LFLLNKKHPYHSFLLQIFHLEMEHRISFLSNNFHQKAQRVLEFVSSTQAFVRKSKLM